MKELTAEKVLENTFNRLNEMLSEEQTTDDRRQTADGAATPAENRDHSDSTTQRESAVERD